MHAIGAASAGRGVVAGPGLSVKLSALHPRYARSQRERVLAELVPRLAELARLGKRYGVGLALDAEEADRLELSLDVVEAIARDPSLDGWDGLGIVVQAYLKRAPAVIDWIVALARDHRPAHDGAAGEGRLLGRRDQAGAGRRPRRLPGVHAQGAHATSPTSPARACCSRTATSCSRSSPRTTRPRWPPCWSSPASREGYEFQCLHGMGEALYDHVVGPAHLDLPCRIYAPVGTHETLLAYLVRRLLENGANTSFVHQVADTRIDVAQLVADPAGRARATGGAPHPRLPLPAALYPDRRNSRGVDLANEHALARLEIGLREAAAQPFVASPYIEGRASGDATLRPARSPADRRVTVGYVAEASRARRRGRAGVRVDARHGLGRARRRASAPTCSSTPPT